MPVNPAPIVLDGKECTKLAVLLVAIAIIMNLITERDRIEIKFDELDDIILLLEKAQILEMQA